jgi:hypothetical protein
LNAKEEKKNSLSRSKTSMFGGSNILIQVGFKIYLVDEV